MVKNVNLVIPNMTFNEFQERMEKINKNYRNYKNEWCISVQQEGNVFSIVASSKDRYIASSRGSFEEFRKIMKITVTEENNQLLTEKSFKFKPTQLVEIRLFPYLSYFLLLAVGLYILVLLILNQKLHFWITYTGFLLAIVAVTNFAWTKNSWKLERARCQIIDEILQKHIYGS